MAGEDEGARRGGAPTPGGATAGTPPTGVCGPDVTAQVTEIWGRIQADFRSWTPAQRLDACTTILIPVQMPHYEPGQNPADFVRTAADINGWDVLPLFQGMSAWLRRPPIYDPTINGPCATPTSLDPGAPAFDDAHESPLTCSDTVQVSGQCWLNGTVNYGTYGIMVRLCHDEFPVRFAFALQMATRLIQAYKALGAHPEDADLPIAWVNATYHGGPTGRPTAPGNRPNCRCACASRGDVVSWDYVWTPAKPRRGATPP